MQHETNVTIDPADERPPLRSLFLFGLQHVLVMAASPITAVFLVSKALGFSDALTVSLTPEEIQRRVRSNLGKFDGYVGINNHMGSRFTADARGMATVMEELHDRGLLYLDSRTTPKTQ